MRLIEGRKLNGVAGADITRGVPCKVDISSIISVTPYTAAPSNQVVVLADKLEDKPYGQIPATINSGDKVIYAYQGLFEYNDGTLAAAVKEGDLVEWTATGVQKLASGQRAGYVAGVSGKTVLIQFDGLNK